MSENNKKSDQKPNKTQRIVKTEQTETREIKQKDETKRRVEVIDEKKKPTAISNTFPPSQPKDDKQDKGGDKNE